MSSFLTLEDINSVVAEYYNVPFWSKVSIGLDSEDDFSNVKFDYCTVSREYSSSVYTFSISVDNDLWRDYCYFHDDNGEYITDVTFNTNNITVISDTANITANFLLNGFTNTKKIIPFKLELISPKIYDNSSDTSDVVIDVFSNNGDDLNGETFTISRPNTVSITVTCTDNQLKFTGTINSNLLTVTYDNNSYILFFKNVKLNRQFLPVTQKLSVGKINTITFLTTPFSVFNAEDITIDCEYPISNIHRSNYNLVFDVDLSNKTDLKQVSMGLSYDSDDSNPFNQVFKFENTFDTITDVTGLTDLLNGGVAYLGADITLTSDLTVVGDVTLFGDDYTIDCDGYKLIVDEGKSLKLENMTIENGVNTIQQLTGSNVELTNCSFTDCTSSDGVGGVIDCDVTLASLDNPTDFTTIITGGSFTNCDCPILHGGELKVTNCEVEGKLSDYDFPYFLYQTDGRAVITQTQFSITNDTAVNEDIKFNSCIFTCGKTATINGMDYNDLQKNEVRAFIERNSSIIDLTYYYEPIEQNITLQSSKGYCHSVSNISQIYKTNIEIIRGE